MTRYADRTEVAVSRSRAEIEKTLERYGASDFLFGMGQEVCMVAFSMNDRNVKFTLPMPDPDSREITHTAGRGLVRDVSARRAALEQAKRQRWRALALAIKAKLECVESGIATFEQEFLAHVMMPDGRTVHEHIRGPVAIAYESGEIRPLLPPPA